MTQGERIIVGCAVLAVAVLGFFLWLDAHDERIRLEAKVAQLETQREADKAETETLKKAKQATFRQARENPGTMIDVIAHEVPFQIEALPGQQPDAMTPPDIKIASPEVPKLLDYTEKCSVCTIELAGAKKEIANLEEQNRELKNAGKPGFWKRVGNCALRGGIGAAPGGIKGDGTQAGIGAGIGIATCFIWRN
jgi:cell division protein FtsB